MIEELHRGIHRVTYIPLAADCMLTVFFAYTAFGKVQGEMLVYSDSLFSYILPMFAVLLIALSFVLILHLDKKRHQYSFKKNIFNLAVGVFLGLLITAVWFISAQPRLIV